MLRFRILWRKKTWVNGLMRKCVNVSSIDLFDTDEQFILRNCFLEISMNHVFQHFCNVHQHLMNPKDLIINQMALLSRMFQSQQLIYIFILCTNQHLFLQSECYRLISPNNIYPQRCGNVNPRYRDHHQHLPKLI